MASGVVLLVTVAAGCGNDEPDVEADATTTTGDATSTTGEEALSNSCPVEGCQVEITDAVKDGNELRLTWTTNFAPDDSRNHIHVYWDTYEPEQVSNDAETAHGVTQGDWVPTDAHPDFVTEGPVSVSQRGTSANVCVTAGDGEHNVIDVSIEQCREVSDLL